MAFSVSIDFSSTTEWGMGNPFHHIPCSTIQTIATCLYNSLPRLAASQPSKPILSEMPNQLQSITHIQTIHQIHHTDTGVKGTSHERQKWMGSGGKKKEYPLHDKLARVMWWKEGFGWETELVGQELKWALVKWAQRFHGKNILKILLGKFQMITNCYGWLYTRHMLKLQSKCSKNVPTSPRLNTCCRYISNVSYMLLPWNLWAHLTKALNVLNM